MQGGVGWGHDDLSLNYLGYGVPLATNNLHGPFGGVHLGYNIARGNLVFGVEGDFEFAGVQGILTASDPVNLPGYSASTTTSIGLQGSARLRAGITPTSGMLLYVTGGLAVADVKDSYSVTLPAGNVIGVPAGRYSQGFSGARWGYTVGGGVEQEVLRNLTARIEYRYTDFGSYQNTFVSGLAAGQKIAEQAVRVGASTKF